MAISLVVVHELRTVDDGDVVLATLFVARHNHFVDLRLIRLRMDGLFHNGLLVCIRVILPQPHDDRLASFAGVGRGADANAIHSLHRNFLFHARVFHHAERPCGTFHNFHIRFAAVETGVGAEIVNGLILGNVFHFQPHFGGGERRWAIDQGLIGDEAGDLEVFFQQGRVHHQGRGNFIETFGCAVGRKFGQWAFAGQKIHVEQVANGVGVLRAIQPAQQHPTAGTATETLGMTQFSGHPSGHLPQLFDVRLWFFRRWHFAQVQPIHDFNPLAGRRRFRQIAPQLIDPKIARLLFLSVAPHTMLHQERLHHLFKFRRFCQFIHRPLRSGPATADHNRAKKCRRTGQPRPKRKTVFHRFIVHRELESNDHVKIE